MNIPSLFGWGSLLISDAMYNYSVSFPSSVHTINFERVATYHTSITGLIHSVGTKWRPIIKCNITICNLDDIRNLILLIEIINTNDQGIMVTPQFSNLNSDNYTYLCYINSNFEPEHILNVLAGQIVLLLFIGRLITDIPIYYSHPLLIDMLFYDGDTGIDDLGNDILMKD